VESFLLKGLLQNLSQNTVSSLVKPLFPRLRDI
jgi:hypothetical protein